jgi:2-succinyl-5-enolpyruvyl-6-hydroxy-3-cyclohexene-1-carboxylate synthase
VHKQVYTIAKVCSEFGCTHAIICPGSRSAPLLYAFKQEKNITCISVIDERSAGFIALGIAQQTGKPVVLICTSGTALLNFFPAIAEAKYQQLPLIVLSADRPPEMLNQQDGQMINQVNVFGSHVRGFLNFDSQNLATGNWQLVIGNLLEKTIYPVKGPVHINVPLVEPLYEELFEELAIDNGQWAMDNMQLANNYEEQQKDFDIVKLSNAVNKSSKKVILVGQGFPDQELASVLKSLEQKGFIILTDIVSNQHESNSISHYDLIVAQATPEILKTLEQTRTKKDSHKKHDKKINDLQLSFFQLDDPVLSQIREQLSNLDVNTLTPMEALLKLHEIKKIL